MIYILIYSHNPLRHALIGAIGALIISLIYFAITFLIAYVRDKKNMKKKEQSAFPLKKSTKINIDSKAKLELVEKSHFFCNYCGNKIDTNSVYCSHCGKKISTDSQTNSLYYKCKKVIRKALNLIFKPLHNIKDINFRHTGIGKWGKHITLVVISAIVLLCLYVLGTWIYHDFWLPHHYESLYHEGMRNIDKADEIALVLFDATNYDNKETKAIEVLENSAEKGNVESMVLLGRYYKGYNIKKQFTDDWKSRFQKTESLAKCSFWFLQAAKKGSAEAQGELGHNYKYGFGIKQDFKKAIYWTKLGADNGNAIAQWRMGNIYLSGLAYYWGDFTDYQIWWYNGSVFIAKDNYNAHLNSHYATNMISRKPEIVFLLPNIKKAKYYWKLSADQGFKKAKNSLEKVYDGDD